MRLMVDPFGNTHVRTLIGVKWEGFFQRIFFLYTPFGGWKEIKQEIKVIGGEKGKKEKLM